MKTFIPIACFCSILLCNSALHAGPFGLDMGMSFKQIQKLSPLKPTESPFMYTATKLSNKHKEFDTILLAITPNNGLCRVIAFTKNISTNSFGTQLKSRFESLEKTLSTKYGINEKFDYLKNESIWSSENDWTMGLKMGERTLEAIWVEKNGSIMKDNLGSIGLRARAVNLSTGFIVINYEFKNFDTCNIEIEQKTNEAL